MNKISLIIQREYLSRVRKKTFIIMTLIGPLLMAALIILPAWLTNLEEDDKKLIAVIDQTGVFSDALEGKEYLQFEFTTDKELDDLKTDFEESDYAAILLIPENVNEQNSPQLYSTNQPSIDTKMYIQKAIEKKIESIRLKELGIDETKLESVVADVDLKTIKWTDTGEEKISSTELSTAIGFIFALLIYMFIFIYGAQVMRGVIEEKTSRVVEIIISSVKPFELMLGKIVGVALVVLTQLSLWILLTIGIVIATQSYLLPDQIDTEMLSNADLGVEELAQLENGNQNEGLANIFKSLENMPVGMLIGSFMFYFLGGYLLYASFFAAIGGAVDNEADTQQFMLPITIPLILAFMMTQSIIESPNGSIALWFSMIPFTSPIVMMVRIPFGVPVWELIVSMLLLVVTFIASTWFAGKIYRTGILMYGKKITYAELWKWLRYKN